MAEKKVAKYDFENEYPIPSDIKKDKIKLDRLKNGYSISYEDEREYKDGNITGFSSYSMSFSETYGKEVEDTNLEVDNDKIKITGRFKP